MLAAELGRGVDGVTLVDLGNLAKRMLQGEQQQQQAEASSSHCNRYLAKAGREWTWAYRKMARVGISVRQNPDARADKMRFDDLLTGLLRFVTFIHSHGIVRGNMVPSLMKLSLFLSL